MTDLHFTTADDSHTTTTTEPEAAAQAATEVAPSTAPAEVEADQTVPASVPSEPVLTGEDLKKISDQAMDNGRADERNKLITEAEVQLVEEDSAQSAAPTTKVVRQPDSPVRDRAIEIWKNSRTVANADVEFAVPFLIDGWLVLGQVSLLWGPSNTGKTNLMMTAVGAVAEGLFWAGHDTTPGAVLVIGAESPSSIHRRGKLLPLAAQEKILVVEQPIDLVSSTADAEAIVMIAKGFEQQTGLKFKLVVVDTLVLCLGEGDENSTRDATRAVASAKLIASALNAHVLLIHHTGKDASAGARGSYAFQANADTVIGLTQKNADGFAYVEAELFKQRDAEKGRRLRFRIVGTPVGTDQKGREITLPVVEFLDAEDFVDEAPPGGPKPGEDPDAVLRALAELEHAAADPGEGFTAREVADQVGTAFKPTSQPDSRRKAVKKVLDDAAAMSPPRVIVSGNRYRMTAAPLLDGPMAGNA